MRQSPDGRSAAIQTPALFSFIGAVPRTDWLPSEIELDPKGFINTGNSVRNRRTGPRAASLFFWKPAGRASLPPGTFGPAPSNALASAVGEGAMAVQFVHEYLKDM